MPEANDGATAAAAEAQGATANGAAEAASRAQDQYMQVQRDQFKDWNGDYTQAVRRARDYDRAEADGVFEVHRKVSELGFEGDDQDSFLELGRTLKQYGVSPKQYVEYLRTADTASQAGQGAQVATQDPDEKPLTRKEFLELQRQQKEESRQQDDVQKWNSAVESEDKFIDQQLSELKLDKRTRQYRFLRAAFKTEAVRDAIDESLPAHIRGEARQKLLQAPATEAQLKRASELFRETLSNQELESIARFAKGQSQLPGATLGGGPAGRPPKKKASELTPKERKQYLAGEIPEDEIDFDQ